MMTLADGWELAQLAAHPGGRSLAAMSDPRGRAGAGGALAWMAARMPAQVHDVLLAHGKIRHPFAIGACAECVWIPGRDWLYRLTFALPASEAGERYFLHCEGLDTVAEVYLNGRRVAAHRDQFLPLRVEVTEFLAERNRLLLHFPPPERWAREQPELKAFFEGGGALRKAIRKGAEDFSFFNGGYPYFAPVGVFAPIRLEAVGAAQIEHLDLVTELSGDFAAGRVRVRAEVGGRESDRASLRLRLFRPDGGLVCEREGGLAQVIELANPELWYPHTFGGQPLYRLEATLLGDGVEYDHRSCSLGFRRIEREGDFDFRVNGKRLKLWGANLTPLPRPGHRHDAALLTGLLEHAVRAHMPVIRVWGPGQPWPRQLYEEADRLGLLLWVEFPYTGRGFPAADAFLDLCRAEARHFVRSFKHHASVLLWSGGNEAYLGLEGAEPPPDDPDRRLFDRVLREEVAALDPGRWYIPNSPFGGSYGNDPRSGDSHIRDYAFFQSGDRYPVMASECARLTVPLAKTLRRHLGPDLAWPEGGFTGARRGFNDDVFPPGWQPLTPNPFWSNVRAVKEGELFDADGTPESFLFRLGAGSALYIRETVERIRRGRPHHRAAAPRRCMGFQWWKLNDTFPMLYASLIDDCLEPNMAYYALRRAYAPVLVCVEIDDGAFFWVVNDGPEDLAGSLEVRLLDSAGGKVLGRAEFPVAVAQGDSRPVGDAEGFRAIARQSPLLLVLRDSDGGELASALAYLAREREIWYPEETGLAIRREGDELILGCEHIARWVELDGQSAAGDAFGWYFEDNFFDLVPGREKRVRIVTTHAAGVVRARSRYARDETVISL